MLEAVSHALQQGLVARKVAPEATAQIAKEAEQLVVHSDRLSMSPELRERIAKAGPLENGWEFPKNFLPKKPDGFLKKVERPEPTPIPTPIKLPAGNDPFAPQIQQARADAEALWFKAQPRAEHDPYRDVEREAISVNADFGAELDGRAMKLMERNAPIVENKLGALGETGKAQYQAILGQTEGFPQAGLALQMLLMEGSLTKYQSTAGKNLLETLHEVATQPLNEAIPRNYVVSDLLQELANPIAISQHNRGTCTVTAVQMYMALEHPAEYARIIGGLASPEGKVKLADGRDLARLAGTEVKDGTPRSTPARLWQPASMQYAKGQPYDNLTDKFADGSGGLSYLPVDKLLDSLTGKNVKHMSIYEHDGPQAMLQAAKGNLDQGHVVPVALSWGVRQADGSYPAGHQVLLNRMSEEHAHYHNPWGQSERMPWDEFNARLKSVHLEPFQA